MVLTQKAINAARVHALKSYPEESCGLVIAGEYHACVNSASDASTHDDTLDTCGCRLCAFSIDPREHLALIETKGEIECVVHSHPNGPLYPSKSDMRSQIDAGVPFAILATDGERVSNPIIWGDDEIAPLIGREFTHGVTDCYSIIRDAFRLGKVRMAEQGMPDWPYNPILLPDVARNDCWWEDDEDLYQDHFEKFGFRTIAHEEVRPGDVFLTAVKSNKLNHGGILVSPDLILHHLPRRLSARVPAGLWKRAVNMWIRYDA